MNRLLLLGLNHTTAPVALRERVALAGDGLRNAVATFREKYLQCEIAIVSTCNRLELYTARPTHGHPRVEEMVDFIASVSGVPAETLKPHVYQKANRDAVAHLFAVAASLDSMVLGETQVLGQVRDAYSVAQSLGATGPGLDPLFQRAVAVGREVLSETALAAGRTSVASLAVDCTRAAFDTLSDKTILSVGAGAMAGLVLQGFAPLRPARVLVCNRDGERADRLAGEHGGTAIGFDRLAEGLVAADVVVTSVGAPSPLVTRALYESLPAERRSRRMHVVDVGLPRDVEPSLRDMPNVCLHDLDDLQAHAAATHAARAGSLGEAQAIVDRHVAAYVSWSHARAAGPVIDRLYARYHALANEELSRTLGKLSNVDDAERAHLQDLTRRIVNKLLHDPVKALRTAPDQHSPPSQFLHALERLLGNDDRSRNADE